MQRTRTQQPHQTGDIKYAYRNYAYHLNLLPQEPITRSVQLLYKPFATAFSKIGLFLDAHGNNIFSQNLNSGSHENSAKLETG